MNSFSLKRLGPIYLYHKTDEFYDTGRFIVKQCERHLHFRFILSTIVYVTSILATCYMQWPALVSGYVIVSFLEMNMKRAAFRQNWNLIIITGLSAGLIIRICLCVYRMLYIYGPIEAKLIGILCAMASCKVWKDTKNKGLFVRYKRLTDYEYILATPQRKKEKKALRAKNKALEEEHKKEYGFEHVEIVIDNDFETSFKQGLYSPCSP